MARHADLHCHSRRSDGTCDPAEVVRRAHKAGVGLLVLSDHDSISGFPEARAEAAKLKMDFACGIEINTCEADGVHILGYGFDPESPALIARLEEFRRRRESRVGLIVERLNALGVPLTVAEVKGESTETLGRPHVADALRRKRVVKDRAEAFKRFLTPEAPAYVPPMGPTVADAVEAIKAAGGWNSLAHPGTVKRDFDLTPWVEAGLTGIEACYRKHTGPQTQRFMESAKRFGLLVTGGSDFHGPGTGREDLGGVDIPDEYFSRIHDRLRLVS